ncbi:hypothetical protein CC1G_09720 [Coprinopsis cinerea okayama7|uniref:PARP catalytic domain-containing protein n=1 Tax=Coprinopsis cinerea (strain Okayama-7 / 130 / ATCC MYA-4618 / FGSC 9003) TaxID=240176 RepID=A8NJG6_COPC7|nr:hypothetical protein CC1G_09720 [Coprinopsis cinerea okayama7\|eukprot:XP_001834220.2 hypothetical protein CC1G_09720 [Coprinopsis cinerea okayama7\
MSNRSTAVSRQYSTTDLSSLVASMDALSVYSPRSSTTLLASPRQPFRAAGAFGQSVGTSPNICIICKERPSYRGAVTCGLTCLEKLATGGGDPAMCNPRLRPLHLQCGSRCIANAKKACLYCRARARNGRFWHFCGMACKKLAMRRAPLVMKVPKGHETYEMVERNFVDSWKEGSSTPPTVTGVYKVVMNAGLQQPYDDYKNRVGNERFLYHGTTRTCKLGKAGSNQTQLCNNGTCGMCNVVKTSFKVSLAKRSGAFGAGIYTSSASNKAYSHPSPGGGVVFVTKVVVGKARAVTAFQEVKSCPRGYDSVVFDRHNGARNETVVYRDDAIRPVFMITFS